MLDNYKMMNMYLININTNVGTMVYKIFKFITK